MGKLTPTYGNYTFAIVAVEYFTKSVEAKLVTNITSATIQNFLWQNIICCYGVPQQITVNNAKYFDSAMFKDFCHQVGTKVSFASVYHQQSNGAVKRTNALIFEVIKKILEGEKKGKWVEVMPRAVWSHNTMVYRATNFTPSGYCSELRQYYRKKLSTKVCVQQRRHHHVPTKPRKKTCWN
jgi:hypothetical protein